jgi:hypothetical protein
LIALIGDEREAENDLQGTLFVALVVAFVDVLRGCCCFVVGGVVVGVVVA